MSFKDLFHTHICKGYGDDVPYATIQRGGIDGIGREHARCVLKCDACGTVYPVCNIHLIDTAGQDATIANLNRILDRDRQASLVKELGESLEHRTKGIEALSELVRAIEDELKASRAKVKELTEDLYHAELDLKAANEDNAILSSLVDSDDYAQALKERKHGMESIGTEDKGERSDGGQVREGIRGGSPAVQETPQKECNASSNVSQVHRAAPVDPDPMKLYQLEAWLKYTREHGADDQTAVRCVVEGKAYELLRAETKVAEGHMGRRSVRLITA